MGKAEKDKFVMQLTPEQSGPLGFTFCLLLKALHSAQLRLKIQAFVHILISEEADRPSAYQLFLTENSLSTPNLIEAKCR
jgi:hypothetical protein